MDKQVNYLVNHGGNFVIKSPLCSFFRHEAQRTPITTTICASF
jgi:hypothetical protein